MSGFDSVSIYIKLATAGTSACIADAVTFPLDTAKVRLQVTETTTHPDKQPINDVISYIDTRRNVSRR